MALSSINFQKTKSNSVAETTREFEAKYLLKKEDRQNNEYWNCGKSDSEVFEEELSKANRKGGRVPKLKNSIWEAVVNLNAKQDMKDLKKLAKHIEKKFNITCTRIAIHRDEGHYDENGKVQYNYHAHMNFVTYKEGKQNWRREYINKKVLSELQTETAKILDMDRGEVDSKSVRANHRQFRANAEKIQEERKLLAKQQDLKEEITRLRAELKQNGAVRSDYAQLEQLNKDLKQQIKDKTLTISDLQDKIKGLEKSNDKYIGYIQEIGHNLSEQGLNVRELKDVPKLTKTLIEEHNTIKNQNKSLQEQKTSLEEQILDLGKKINSNPIMLEYEEQIKEKQKQLDQYEETFEKLDDLLLTNEDRKNGKEYLKRFEIIERVSNLSKLVDKYKRAFDEFSKLLEKPKQTFNGIRLAIMDKLKQGEKSSNNLINKIVDQVKTLHEKKDLKTQIDQENELKKTKNSDSSFKKKRNK